jgi:hypothetical protein
MAYSVEFIHDRFTSNYCNLTRIIEVMKECAANCEQSFKDSLQINLLGADIGELIDEYKLSTIKVLADYYAQGPEEDAHESQVSREYQSIIIGRGYIEKCEGMIARMKTAAVNLRAYLARKPGQTKKGVELASSNGATLASSNGATLASSNGATKKSDLAKCIAELETITFSIDSNFVLDSNVGICPCGTKLEMVIDSAEYVCGSCGMVYCQVGSIFRGEQASTQDSQKTKHSKYDTTRHLKCWLERLQALEPKTIPESVMAEISYVIKRDGYKRTEITYPIMRSILKDPAVNATKYNDHIPFLIQTFGDEKPPRLSHDEFEELIEKFNLVTHEYEKDNPDDNKPYYPFIICQIITDMFANDPEKMRLRRFIHFQSRGTTKKHRDNYATICKRIESLGFKCHTIDPHEIYSS